MKKLLATGLVLFASTAFAATPNLTGQWTVHVSIAGNDADIPCTFTATEKTIGGSCKGPDGKDAPLAGSIDGEKITWKYDSEYNGTPLTNTYTVTGTDGAKITGSVEVQPFGVTGDFTATPSRSESAAVVPPTPTKTAGAAHTLTGKYSLHQSVAGNDNDSECAFVQTDARLTGTCKGQEKDLEIKGSIDGKKATWQYESEYNGTPLTVKFNGTVDDSGKIVGTLDVDPFGVSGEFTATPSKSDGK
jgi:hypothetical protein